MIANVKKYCLTVMFCAGLLVAPCYAGANPVVLDLDSAIQMALRNNPKTFIADGELKSAEGNKKQAIGQFGPQVTFNHNSTRSHSYQPASVGGALVYQEVSENFSNTARVTLPVFTAGKRQGTISASRRNYEIAELEIGRTNQEVKLDATTAYFDVLQTRNLVKLNQESVTRLEEHLKNVQAQFSVGIVAKVDVLRSEVELADAQQELIKAENNYDIAIATLNNVVGLPLDTELVVNEELTHEEYIKTIEDCIDFSNKHRPEILQAEKAIRAAKSSVLAARSGYYPNVSVSAAYQWDKDDFPGDQKSNWSVGATLNFNVFDSQVTRGAVDTAQGNLLQREASYKQTKDNVFLAVRSNYLSLREAEKRIQTSSVTVEKAQEDYMIAQVRYQAGVGTNTDVLDAQVALTKAQVNYVQALYDYNTSWANLENAMGVPVFPEDDSVKN